MSSRPSSKLPAAKPRQAKVASPKPAARVGRPTPERAAAIDEAILEAARIQFLEHGCEATSMETIASTASVSKGTLYARYATKTALLRAVVTRQVQAWGAKHIRHDPLPQDFKQRLQHLARGILAALMDEESRPYQRLAHRAASDGEFAATIYELGLLPAFDGLAEEIRQGSKDFPMPILDAALVARMIHATLYGWWAEREAGGGATTDEANAFADRAIDIVFYGRAAW